MPTSTPERRARWWPDDDLTGTKTASQFLLTRGYALRIDWAWRKPAPDYEVTEEEYDAITYLMEEFDFGGLAVFDDGFPLRRGR